jgi:UDP-2-acetamido-2,6-beta-L-arabino-hexul-4-ose reductase
MLAVVTGAAGFIGRNLVVRLQESGHRVFPVTRDTGREQLAAALSDADFVFHLAGVNRPTDDSQFMRGNAGVTEELCAVLRGIGRAVPVLYASSTQTTLCNPYGQSKLAAEEALARYGRDTGAAVHVCRLTNVFGKWSRPYYNSAVATFCHQLARGLPIKINDPAVPLRLVYIDDVIEIFLRVLGAAERRGGPVEVTPVYETTVGEVAQTLQEFAESRSTLALAKVGSGLTRALYATFISHLPPESFVYDVPRYSDPRGVFVELLKTPDSGQFSYFTAHSGVTRGEHYHHTKIEKFMVVHGTARFGFRNISTNETQEFIVRGGDARIVESVPGWAHNVTNIGEGELLVMLWASEVFDRLRPDTVATKVKP